VQAKRVTLPKKDKLYSRVSQPVYRGTLVFRGLGSGVPRTGLQKLYKKKKYARKKNLIPNVKTTFS
jgi:hypothetical protein